MKKTIFALVLCIVASMPFAHATPLNNQEIKGIIKTVADARSCPYSTVLGTGESYYQSHCIVAEINKSFDILQKTLNNRNSDRRTIQYKALSHAYNQLSSLASGCIQVIASNRELSFHCARAGFDSIIADLTNKLL